MVWAFPADSTTFNTVIQVESVDSQVQNLQFPYLALNDLETGQNIPYLTTWEISEDGLTYTFTIVEEAVWSDGTPITSTDVAFTLNSMFSDNVETFRTISGLESINILDDKHFEIVLAAPTCGLFSQIGVGIMPAHKFAADYSDFMTSEFNTNPDVSGGPFRLVERSVDEFLRFEANDTFFMGKPNIDQMLLQVIVDPQVAIQSVESGESDYVAGLTSETVAPFLDNPNFNVHVIEANGWQIMLFNHADPAQPSPARDESGALVEQPPHPILGDPRVRQALVMGWDHEDGVFLAGEGARRLVGPVAPILADAYNNDLELYPFDAEAAGALLDEAGWVLNGDVREKDGVPMALDLAYLGAFEDTAAVVADYWTDLGVDVTLTTGEQGVIIGEHVAPQTFDVFMVQATWNEPTPDVLLNFLWNSANDFGTNFGSFINEEFDGILTDLTTAECAPEARKPLYDRAQEIMHEGAVTDFISTVVAYGATSSRIGNVEFTTWGSTPTWTWTIND
ncbi:MAG: ABC transporter substrate-binding protein [Chloroflexi bacterium]|nr:ABC transporter substrate-binding protein [Chloroflexota bacterium]